MSRREEERERPVRPTVIQVQGNEGSWKKREALCMRRRYPDSKRVEGRREGRRGRKRVRQEDSVSRLGISRKDTGRGRSRGGGGEKLEKTELDAGRQGRRKVRWLDRKCRGGGKGGGGGRGGMGQPLGDIWRREKW